ncbi:MAG: alpha-amylase family glycosyl hydrolase, partial [Candidatus Limnocylindrales bacterium]
APSFRAAIRRRERAFGDERWPTVVLSNHDQPRHASRLTASVTAAMPAQDAIAKAAAVILLTVRGTPFLYYGEEIGMGDADIPADESIDPPAARVTADFPWWDRSRSRTPMPWTGGPNGGFSPVRPWLRLGNDTAERNVAAQAADPDSVLACYRRLLRARRASPSLQDGRLRLVKAGDPDILAYRRVGSGPDVLVAIAFQDRGGTLRLPSLTSRARWRPLAGTHLDLPTLMPGDDTLALRGYEGLILVATDI